MSKAARRMVGSIAEAEAFIDRIYKMNRITKAGLVGFVRLVLLIL
jgi:hypothetical protein